MLCGETDPVSPYPLFRTRRWHLTSSIDASACSTACRTETQLAEVVKAAREAGATGVWAVPLDLRRGTREHLLEQLGRDRSEQLPRYEALYAARRLPRRTMWRSPVQELFADLRGAGTASATVA